MNNYTEASLNLERGETFYNKPNVKRIFKCTTSDKRTVLVEKNFVKNLKEANLIIHRSFTRLSIKSMHLVNLSSGIVGGNDSSIMYVLFEMDYFDQGNLEKEIFTRSNEQQYWEAEKLLQIFKTLVSVFALLQMKSIAHKKISPHKILKKDHEVVDLLSSDIEKLLIESMNIINS